MHRVRIAVAVAGHCTHQHNTMSDTDHIDAAGPIPELAALEDDFARLRSPSKQPAPKKARHEKGTAAAPVGLDLTAAAVQ